MSTILILGGSGGIGREIIRLFLEHEHRVINVDMKCSHIQNPLLSEVIIRLDQSNTRAVISQILAKEKIDNFICAIGYYGTKILSEFDMADYENTFMINVTVPLLSAIEIAKFFTNRNEGKMIFISSAAAYVGSRDIAYSLSKAAINGIIHGLAKNFENKPLYVYGVAPGIIDTEMSQQMTELRQRDAVQRTLNKRMGKADNVGKVIRFLIEEDDGYMNGSIVHINNGLYFN